MPFRFRRGIRFAPGVRLHLGENGLSATVDPRAAHITVSHGETTATSPPLPEITHRAAPTPAGRVVHWLVAAAGALGLAWWFGWL